MKTTESPTYFGPAESPLFGVLHLPSDRKVREGILLCPSLGKEAADSTRFQRILADDLASRGFAVLRFDYLGTGDSAHDQSREDAVPNWIDSVTQAAGYLKGIGVEGISVIAHRIGSVIGEAALQRSPSEFKRAVFIDPVLSGRRYLREQSSLFKMTIGVDASVEGTVSIVGARIAGGAAKELGALTLDGRLKDAAVERLFVIRADDVDAPVGALARDCEIPIIPVEHLNSTLLLPMPLQAAEEIVSWFDRRAPTHRVLSRPVFELRALMPGAGPDDARVVETIEQIGPKRLFAIRTVREGQLPRTAMVTLFCATSIDPHTGPSREWVELSRRIAAGGYEALRWDREGLGNSAPVERGQWHRIYRRSEIADAIAAAHHANPDPALICAVGVCSGSWYAAHAARRGAANHVVLINPILWSWNASASWFTEWIASRRLTAPDETPISQVNPSGSAPRLAQIAARARHGVRRAFHRHVPRRVALLLSRLGVSRMPEAVLARLAHEKVGATVILGPEDVETFEYQGGTEAVQRLQRTSAPPELVAVGQGDHGAYHQAILKEARRVIVDVLSGSRGEVVSGEADAESPPPFVLGTM